MLVQQLRAGDARAFQAFYADYFPRLYRFVAARGGDARWVEEVVQATLVLAVRGLDGFRGDASLFSWLCRIALREAMRARERQQVRDQREVSMDDGEGIAGLAMDVASEPDAAHERGAAQAEVHALLDALPPRFGDVLEMKYVEGLSVQEIASRMAVGATAVQSLLARARGAFRAAWARRHGDETEER